MVLAVLPDFSPYSAICWDTFGRCAVFPRLKTKSSLQLRITPILAFTTERSLAWKVAFSKKIQVIQIFFLFSFQIGENFGGRKENNVGSPAWNSIILPTALSLPHQMATVPSPPPPSSLIVFYDYYDDFRAYNQEEEEALLLLSHQRES